MQELASSRFVHSHSNVCCGRIHPPPFLLQYFCCCSNIFSIHAVFRFELCGPDLAACVVLWQCCVVLLSSWSYMGFPREYFSPKGFLSLVFSLELVGLWLLNFVFVLAPSYLYLLI